jgi:hypothetical protein
MAERSDRDVLLKEFFAALDAVEIAGAALTEHLARKQGQIAALRVRLEEGANAAVVLPFPGSDGERSARAVVGRLEAARVEAQKAAYRLANADGLTAAEIARAYEVSRQLVSRVLNEDPRGEKSAGAVTPRVGSERLTDPSA